MRLGVRSGQFEEYTLDEGFLPCCGIGLAIIIIGLICFTIYSRFTNKPARETVRHSKQNLDSIKSNPVPKTQMTKAEPSELDDIKVGLLSALICAPIVIVLLLLMYSCGFTPR